MKPRRNQFRGANVWQIVLAGYWLALFVSTHLPQDVPLVPGDYVDKPIHVSTFSVLALLLAATWQAAAGKLIRSHLWMVWVVVVLYGALDEWTQSFVGRTVSVGDWLADAAGGVVGLIVFQLWQGPGRRSLRRFLEFG